MTAPIQFPSLSPAPRQPAQRQDSGVDDFVQLMLSMAQHRQQIAIQREGLALERQRTESQVSEATTRTAGEKQEQKKRAKDMEEHDEELQAQDIASRHFLDVLTAPGGISPDALNKARLSAVGENKKLAPRILKAIDALAQGAEKSRNDMAQRREAERNADVLERTKGVAVQTAQTQLSIAQSESALRAAQVNLDPMRVSQMQGYMERGATAGQAARLSGIKLPKGVAEDYMLPKPEGSGGNATQQRAGPLLNMFRGGRALAEGAGAVPLNFVNTWRARSNSAIVEGLGNIVSSDKQQQLLAGYRLMGNAFRFSISGAASAVAEENRLFVILAPVVGDDPATVNSKRQLWDVVESSMAEAASGNLTPTGAMDRIITTAKLQKAPPATMKLLEQQRADAKKFEASPDYKMKVNAATPADATGDPVVGRFFRPTP